MDEGIKGDYWYLLKPGEAVTVDLIEQGRSIAIQHQKEADLMRLHLKSRKGSLIKQKYWQDLILREEAMARAVIEHLIVLQRSVENKTNSQPINPGEEIIKGIEIDYNEAMIEYYNAADDFPNAERFRKACKNCQEFFTEYENITGIEPPVEGFARAQNYHALNEARTRHL